MHGPEESAVICDSCSATKAVSQGPGRGFGFGSGSGSGVGVTVTVTVGGGKRAMRGNGVVPARDPKFSNPCKPQRRGQ